MNVRLYAKANYSKLTLTLLKLVQYQFIYVLKRKSKKPLYQRLINTIIIKPC